MSSAGTSREIRRIATLAGALVAALATSIGAAGAAAAPPSEDRATLKRASLPKCAAREVAMRADGTRSLSLKCKGANGARAEVVRDPRHGELGSVSQKRDRVRYRPDEGYRGPDHLLVERESGGHAFLTSVRIEVGGREGPDCRDRHVVARSETAVKLRVRCRGAELEKLRLKGARHGEVENIDHDRTRGGNVRTLTARFDPEADFSGQDSIVVVANADERSSLGSIGISVLPWRMRAIGDSVTAGFGFYGDGTAMSLFDLSGCRPPDAVNNRCSSNSDEKGKYKGPPEWSKDFGLGNDVSWAAQFANSIAPNGKTVTAPEMFQNLAVTGSAPTDWLSGGELNDEFEGIIAENPELIAFTLGANPLLSEILLGNTGCNNSQTAQALRTCIEPLFEQDDLDGNLQKVYTALLEGASDSAVVTFHYHLADPGYSGGFSNWQIEAMVDFFNQQIDEAVAETRQALPDEASRLILIKAQVEPGNPQPDTVPRFNIGLPPVSQQTWTATYDCATKSGKLVDGPSHQSQFTQAELTGDDFCKGDTWTIEGDTGVHPNKLGYTQFANTLTTVADQHDLIPSAD